MKGLLLKDWYLTANYCRMFFVIGLVFLLVSFFPAGSFPFMAYPLLLAAMIPMTLYSYDEREKWHIYSAALPVSRAQLVSAKYIVGLLSVAAVLLVTVIVCAVRSLAMPARAAAYLPMLAAAAGLGLIAPAISLPLMFRFGAEKARILYLFIVGIITASFAFLDGDGAPSVIGVWPAIRGVLCAAGLALYALSWLLSVALYKKREL